MIKIEPRSGDPLHRWSITGVDLGNEDEALFQYLNASKRSVIGVVDEVHRVDDEKAVRLGDTEILIASADLLIEDLPHGAYDRHALRERHLGLVIVSITPFGLTGPMAERFATDFTIQAECGSIGVRGRPCGEPYQAGGGIYAWAGGCFAAVAALAAVRSMDMTSPERR